MNVLLVYAHFEGKSFNAAMRRIAERTLAQLGHSVEVADLYREGFNPVPDPRSFRSRADDDHFELMAEQAHANATGSLPADQAIEQARVERADLLLFQFPFWWWSMPAILKGWIDRIFSNGFAYGERNLGGKAAMLAVTAETRASRFEPGADRPILEPIEKGILGYCGLTVLPRFVAAEILSIDAARRAALLDEFAAHLRDHLPGG